MLLQRKFWKVWESRCCRFALCMALMLTAGGCRINEDLSVCDRLDIAYRVQIVTTITTTIHSELNNTIAEQRVGALLQEAFDSIFRDYAQDLDMLFYQKNGFLYQHEQTMMNATNRTFQLKVPADDYDHVAVANVENEPTLQLTDDTDPATFAIHQQQSNIVESHSTGIYTARKEILKDQPDEDGEYRVSLYLVNAAVAVVIDTQGFSVDSVDMWVQGMATDFAVMDSVYSFQQAEQQTHARRLVNDTELLCNYVVCMPSQIPSARATNRAGELVEDNRQMLSDEVLWNVDLRIQMANGTVATTRLGMYRALLPGYLMVVKLHLNADGTVSLPVTAGASVAIDWQSIQYPDVPLGSLNNR